MVKLHTCNPCENENEHDDHRFSYSLHYYLIITNQDCNLLHLIPIILDNTALINI